MEAARRASTILVRTGDTDVVIILLAHVTRLRALRDDIELWVAFCARETRFINVGSLHDSIGARTCAALPMFHALSGSDSTSALKTKGKRLW